MSEALSTPPQLTHETATPAEGAAGRGSTTRRTLLVSGAASVAAFALLPSRASAQTLGSAPALIGTATTDATRRSQSRRWAADTWRSLERMTDSRTGLPADNIPESLAAADRSGYTSPTNIGGYLWSTVVARELGLITPRESTARLMRTLHTLARLQHHRPSGMFYNWYDEATGDVITTWPDSGDTVYPFASSVDNGWLGAALLVVKGSDRAAAPLAARLFARMRWDMYYNEHSATRPGGLIHGGFYDGATPPGYVGVVGNYIGVGPEVTYTPNYYDTTVSETRITTYLGLITGQIPAKNYYTLWRTFPDSCDWSWPEMEPVGVTRSYFGQEVYEGAHTYRGLHVVPGWGGSMFEELMPDVFVPEERWAPRSWGRNHPLHVRAQREHGLFEAGYGFWGFSPSSNPAGGYREYGVDALGLNPAGYFSDQESTNYDPGYGDCRPATNPHPTYGDGVVTPHASFLAMMHEPRQAYRNLTGIQHDLGAYGRGGFFDAVAVRSGTIARRYLALDQAMIMGSLGNVLCHNAMRRAFSTRAVERALRPVIGIEQFGAGLA